MNSHPSPSEEPKKTARRPPPPPEVQTPRHVVVPPVSQTGQIERERGLQPLKQLRASEVLPAPRVPDPSHVIVPPMVQTGQIERQRGPQPRVKQPRGSEVLPASGVIVEF